MKTTTRTVLILVVMLVIGCSSKPGLSDGETALRNRINKESEGRLKLMKFQKTGDEGGGGIDGFCWGFTGEIEVVEDCTWLFDSVTGTIPVDFQTSLTAEKDAGRALRQGQRYSLIGAVYLGKGTQGWQAGHIAMRKIPREIH